MEVLDELYWFFCRAPAELGFRAASLMPTLGVRQLDAVAAEIGEEVGGWYSLPTPTKKQMAAAARERRIRQTLARLSPRHRSVLEVAYTQRNRGHLDYEGVQDVRRNLERELARYVEAQFTLAIRDAEKAVALAADGGTAEELSEARKRLTALKQEASGAAEAAAKLLTEAHSAFVAARGPKIRGKKAEAAAWLSEETGRGRGLRPTGTQGPGDGEEV